LAEGCHEALIEYEVIVRQQSAERKKKRERGDLERKYETQTRELSMDRPSQGQIPGTQRFWNC
jgi:hypothetical protein